MKSATAGGGRKGGMPKSRPTGKKKNDRKFRGQGRKNLTVRNIIGKKKMGEALPSRPYQGEIGEENEAYRKEGIAPVQERPPIPIRC